MLKYKITELFQGKFPQPQNLYAQLQDLDRQIEEGADAVPIVRRNVKLTKTALKKEFGDPSKFENIGVVHNTEGSYIVVSDNKKFKIVSMSDI
jgi:hypothetical protein